MATLHYRVDDVEVDRELDRDLSIGRGSGNDLVIRGMSGVSRRHATIRRAGPGYVIEDLGSRNGTRIERGGSSIEVEGATTLEAGDTIVLGGLRVRFQRGRTLDLDR